jgi:hypothetical protein
MVAYATRTDVYKLALRAQAFVCAPRVIVEVDDDAGTLTLPGHGLSDDDPVRLSLDGAESSIIGTADPALPGGLSASTLYYAQPVADSSDLFKLSTSVGGSPIASFTDAGAGTFGLVVDHGPALDACLVATAAIIDEHLTAHEPPIQVDPDTGVYPPILVEVNAVLAGIKMLRVHGLQNPLYRDAASDLLGREKFYDGILATWLAGKPVQPRPRDQNTIPDNSALAEADTEPTAWRTGYL